LRVVPLQFTFVHPIGPVDTLEGLLGHRLNDEGGGDGGSFGGVPLSRLDHPMVSPPAVGAALAAIELGALFRPSETACLTLLSGRYLVSGGGAMAGSFRFTHQFAQAGHSTTAA